MFHCKLSGICIHVEDVCDGHKDCPHKDNELMCELRNLTCPKTCNCLNFAIFCNSSASPDDISKLPFVNLPFVSVHISFTTLSSLKILNMFDHVIWLRVSHNKFSSVCDTFSHNNSIVFVDIGCNIIEELLCHCLNNITKIESLYLNNNLLGTIYGRSFSNMQNYIFLIYPITT